MCIKEKFDQFQSEISEVIYMAPGRPLRLDENTLRDLPCISEQPDDDDIDFRWPKLEDLQAIQLSRTLKLKEILAKGNVNDDLIGIQLVF